MPSASPDPRVAPRAGLPPGPRFAAVQSLRYLTDPFAWYERMADRFGDLYTVPTLNGTAVFTTTPEGAREILAGREEDFVVGFGVDAVTPFVGARSLLLTSGDRHKADRKLLSPTFHGARMRAYAATVRDAVVREVETWLPGQTLAAQTAMQRVSLDVILRAVIGVQSPERHAALRDAVRRGVDEVSPAPIFFRSLQREFGGYGPWARFLRRRAELDTLLYRQIDEAREAIDREDVLAGLLAARGEDGSGLSDGAVRDQLMTLLVAGHETTATALAWALYELHRHPRVLDRVRLEIAELGPDPAPEALVGVPYLEAVCRETLRLHPIVLEFVRTVRERFVLRGWEIPAGVSVAGSIWMIHRDERLYPEPERFLPSRFVERRFAPFEFAAFGGGHRHCIGAAFAMNELQIALGTLLPRVELSLATDRPLRTVRRNLTLAPERGVPLVVERRLAPAVTRAA